MSTNKTLETLEDQLYVMFPCSSCGVDADEADGFGKCTCGNENKRHNLLALFEQRETEEQLKLLKKLRATFPDTNDDTQFSPDGAGGWDVPTYKLAIEDFNQAIDTLSASIKEKKA